MRGNEKERVLSLMVQDHSKIVDLLDEVESRNREGFEELKEAFEIFEWNLEKHIFAEEKAVFTFYEPEDVTEGYKMLPKLTEHHNYLLNELKKWRKKIRQHRALEGVYDFREYLVKHRRFEEEEFYPKLEENLDKDQKRRVIAKINEII
ncbi:MAG: hemerythrin domain-containing protein [Candidatus Thermoplasmatota archaeon]